MCRHAADRPDVPFLLVDVEASAANRALAMEKTLTRPASQRKCGFFLRREEPYSASLQPHRATRPCCSLVF